MKTATAVKHFRSKYNIANLLGITRQSVGQWGSVVPADRAIQLQKMSGDKIKVDPNDYTSK